MVDNDAALRQERIAVALNAIATTLERLLKLLTERLPERRTRGGK